MSTFEILNMLKDFNSIMGDPTGVSGSLSEAIRVIAIITFLFSILECFFGYKLFKFWVAVCGFFSFGILGAMISVYSSSDSGMVVFVGILSAILGAFIAFKLYKIGVFILCGVMGFLLGYLLTQSATLAIVMALILGTLSVFFIKPVIIISTSVSSGLFAGKSLAIVLGINDSPTSIFLSVLFVIAGLLVQFVTNKQTNTKNLGVSQNNNVQPFNNTERESLNNTQPKKNDVVNDFSKKTSEIVTTIKATSIKAGDNLWTKLKNKIAMDNSIVMKRTKGVTMDNIFEDLEELFYSRKTLKYIMPYVEYILYFISFMSILSPLLILNQLAWTSINITILILVGILCFSKKMYNAIAISFSLVTLSRLIMLIKLGTSPYYNYNLFALLIDTVVTGYIAIIATKCFFKSEKGISFTNKLYELIPKPKYIGKSESIVQLSENHLQIDVNCPKCDEVNNETDKFCGNCGERLAE